MCATDFTTDPLGTLLSVTSMESVREGADRAMAFLNDNPWAPTAAAGLLVVIGLSLWFAGARIAKPAMIATFAIAGVIIGGAMARALDADPFWIWTLAGGALGCVTGVIVFRLAVAGVIAVVLALAAPATAAITQDIDLIPEETRLATMDSARTAFATPTVEEAEAMHDSDSLTAVAVGRARSFAGDVAHEAAAAWSGMSDRDQVIIAATALGGALLGLAIGLFWPGASAAMVTSALGAAIWVPAGFALLGSSGWAASRWVPQSGMTMLGVWLGATVVGTMAQTALLTRKRMKTRVVHVHHEAQPAAQA